jgi:hypothetical protein
VRGSDAEENHVNTVPPKMSVLLFCASVAVSLLMVLGALGYALYHGNTEISANNQQWCTALRVLTKTPVAPPVDPARNPSRVFAYNLYESFMSIEKKFGC